jgi:hypothetical protein
MMGFRFAQPILRPSQKKKGAAIISRRLVVSASRSQRYFGCGTMRM